MVICTPQRWRDGSGKEVLIIEPEVLDHYKRSIDNIYNDSEQGRQLVLKYFGIAHIQV